MCELCDSSGRSAWPEVASGLTPDSIQKKYAQTVVSAWIAPGCVQSLGAEKCFHTACQGSITGPEVVELQTNTEIAKFTQSQQGFFIPAKNDVFGDLQLEGFGRQSAVTQRSLNILQ